MKIKKNKLLFLNDINKNEINLNNFELLNIWTYGKYKASIIKGGEESIKLNNKNNNNIIFHIKSIKHLRLAISSNCDNLFIEKYFDLNLSDILGSKPLNKKRTTFLDLINKKENYFKMMSMKDLKYSNISYRYQYHVIQSYIRSFTMETAKNDLKKYSYSVSHFNKDAYISNQTCLKEIYEENEKKIKF